MTLMLRSVKVPPNSSLEKVTVRVFDFFRLACRSIPKVMKIYNLDVIITGFQLRSTIAAKICKHAHITNPAIPRYAADYGLWLIRDGGDIYKSPIQQHVFNQTYQLGSSKSCERPTHAQVLTAPVEVGDIIVVGTNRLLGNLFLQQFEEAANMGIKQGFNPQDVAWTVAERTYYISINKTAFTPFMQASIDVAKTHIGGKSDNITVIISYIVGA